MALVVGEAYLDSYRELCLCRVSLGRHGLVALCVVGYLALKLEVAIASYLYQLCMVRELVLQSVVEHWPHRSPDIRRADGELGYLYRLHDIVVYARLVELIADGAADDCQHEHGQQYVDCFPHILWFVVGEGLYGLYYIFLLPFWDKWQISSVEEVRG